MEIRKLGYYWLDTWVMANVIQLATQDFCMRFLNQRNDPCGRQFDQMTQAGTVNVQDAKGNGESGEVPAQLDTPRARELWQKAIEQGWVDEQWQPLLSRPLAALLADRMAEVLGIATKWKVFEQLWRRKNMRNDYNAAINQQQCDEYMKKFKRIIY